MRFKLIKESMLNLLRDLNLEDEILIESRADELRLIDFAGEDLAKRFLVVRKRFKSPENDLYYWIKNKTVDDLRAAVEAIENSLSNTQQRKQADQGAELVGQNEFWKVYHITTYEASQKYGRDTKWCITGIDGYGRKYWDDYTKTGVEFYFYISTGEINPRGRYGKYALALSPNDEFKVYDQQDNEAYGVPKCPQITGLPDIRTVEVKHYVYDGTTIPDNLNRTIIETIDIAENVNNIPFATFYDFANLQKVTIPNNVKNIGPCAFRGCTNLTNVVISEGVKQIEDLIFLDCKALKTIQIPKSVTSISPHAFVGCKNITIYCPQDSYAAEFAHKHSIPVNYNESIKV